MLISQVCSARRKRFSSRRWSCVLIACLIGWAGLCLLAPPLTGAEKGKSSGKGTQIDPVKRAEAVRRLCERLGVGPGGVVADVGCGKGPDTLTFAEVVGSHGKVYAEEISQKLLDEVTKKAQERNLTQVVTVLGSTEDPHLPAAASDLFFMHYVFHHFAKPIDMLQHLWTGLKPGGYLLIVDRQKGPQREWVDWAEREKKHHWTGETTVVRLAREAGFLFETTLDELWPEKEPFVLVFRKPKDIRKIAGDPDLPIGLNGKTVVNALPPIAANSGGVAFIGLDQGRSVLPALQAQFKSRAHIYDVMLEEWTTRKDELPADIKSSSGDILRAVNGDLPTLPDRGLQAAIFADGYSRLWDPEPMLHRLHQTMKPGGYVAILDLKGPDNEPRRFAGHHRHIAPALVKADLQKAGFDFVKELKSPGSDRFFLLFRLSGTQ